MAERIIPIHIEKAEEQKSTQGAELISVEMKKAEEQENTEVVERVIPIQIEKAEEQENTPLAEGIVPTKEGKEIEEKNVEENSKDSEKKLFKPMEELSITKNKPIVLVKPRVNVNLEILKQFDVFEDRSSCSLPNSNIKEKIILVIDRAQDENFTSFVTNNAKCTPLSMLKRVINLFMKLKQTIDKRHEFAIILLNENNANWVTNFTNDLKRLSNAIEKINECEVEDTFPLNSLFDEILKNTEAPNLRSEGVAPTYLIRTVIFYGRSYTIPRLEMNPQIDKLLANPYFVCDILMTHEPIDKSNHCDKIFEQLQNLDKKGYAYFLPVCRDANRIHSCAGKLLAHSLQRPIQKLQTI